MARKKVLFVIVEGPSDEDALGVLFSRIYDMNAVYIQVVHGDITTDRYTTASNIVSKIGNLISKYAKSNNYVKTDFAEIIHIVDTDGAYVPDNCIKQRDDAKTVYDLEAIYTDCPDKIIQRNIQKRSVLNKLSTASVIYGAPYHIFYMSCNLDHVLYNKQNSSNEEKETDSYRFANKYKSDIQGFLSYIGNSPFSVKANYSESWEYIKRDRHSLQRNTNLALCFPQQIVKII